MRSAQVIVALMTMLVTGLLLAGGSLRTATTSAGRPADKTTLVAVLVVALAVAIVGCFVIVAVLVSIFSGWLRQAPLRDDLEAHTDRVRSIVVRHAVEASGTGGLIGVVLGVGLGFALSPSIQSSLPQVEQGYHPFDSPTVLVPLVVVAGALGVGIVAALAAVSRALRSVRAARGELAAPPGPTQLTAGRWFLGLVLVAAGIGAALLAVRSGVPAHDRAPLVLSGMVITFLGLAARGPALAAGVLRVLGAPFGWTRTGGFALRHALRCSARSAQLMLVLAAGTALITLCTIFVDGVDGSLGVAIAVAVAVVGVAVTVSRSVDERAYEVRVMRTVGASGRQIHAALIAEGALVGLGAAIVGVVVALGFASAITGVDALDVPMALLAVLAVLGPAGGAWAAYRPAVHAERRPALDAVGA
jgi:putative ABC transport system permease protein